MKSILRNRVNCKFFALNSPLFPLKTSFMAETIAGRGN